LKGWLGTGVPGPNFIFTASVQLYVCVSTLLYVSVIFCYRQACFTQRDKSQCAFGAQFAILRKLRRMTAKPSLICDCFILWVPGKEGRIFSETLVYHCHNTRLHIPEANNLETYNKALECGAEVS